MKAELKALGRCLWAMLKEFLTSKKVLTAILTSVAGIFIKDSATRDHVLAVGVTLIGGIAIADAGASVGAKKADAPAPTDRTLTISPGGTVSISGPAPVVPLATKP